MYGFSGEMASEILNGLVLEQVAFGQFDVIMTFQKNVSVSIVRTFDVRDSSEAPPDVEAAKMDKSRMIDLLGSHLTNVTATAPTALSLTFSNGAVVTIFDDACSESCIISSASHGIVVV